MATTFEKYANMEPHWDTPVIIESHINGIRVKEMTPHLPLTHDEIAADAIACLDAGASAVHLHNTNFNLRGYEAFLDYKKTWDQIYAKYPDAILYGTTCNVDLLAPDEFGLEHVAYLHDAYKIEQCVIDSGILNAPSGEDEEGYLYGITHGYNLDRLNRQLKMCRERNMGVIFSVFEPGFMRYALHYYKKGMLPKGSSLDLYLIGDYGVISMEPVNTAGAPATMDSLYYYLSMMEGCDLPWFLDVWGAGTEIETPILKRAIELGGHIKVGLEMHYDPVDKPTNVEILKRAQELAREVGRPIATTEQEREILGLK